MDEIQQARIEIGKAQNIPPEQVPQRQAEQRVLAQKIASSKTQLSVSVAPAPTNNKPQSSVFVPSVPVAPTDNIVTDTGEMVDKATFNALSPEDQSLLKAVGVIQYNALKGSQIGEAYEKEIGQYVQLQTGEYFPRASQQPTDTEPGYVGFDDMSLYDQELIKSVGVDKYNQIKQDEFNQSNLEVRPGEYINRTFFEALPENEQGFIRAQGVAAYNAGKQAEYDEKMTLFNRAIQWMSVDDEGRRIINIVDAIDKGGFTIEELKKLEITGDAIRAAYNREPGFNTIIIPPEEQTIGLSQPVKAATPARQGGFMITPEMEELEPYVTDRTLGGGAQYNIPAYLEEEGITEDTIGVLQNIGFSAPVITQAAEQATAAEVLRPYGGDIVQFIRENPNKTELLSTLGYKVDDIEKAVETAKLAPEMKDYINTYMTQNGVTAQELEWEKAYQGRQGLGQNAITTFARINPEEAAAQEEAYRKVQLARQAAYAEYLEKYGGEAVAQSAAGRLTAPLFPAGKAFRPDVEVSEITAGEWAQTAGMALALAAIPLGGATAGILVNTGAVGAFAAHTAFEWKNMTPQQRAVSLAADIAFGIAVGGQAFASWLKTANLGADGLSASTKIKAFLKELVVSERGSVGYTTQKAIDPTGRIIEVKVAQRGFQPGLSGSKVMTVERTAVEASAWKPVSKAETDEAMKMITEMLARNAKPNIKDIETLANRIGEKVANVPRGKLISWIDDNIKPAVETARPAPSQAGQAQYQAWLEKIKAIPEWKPAPKPAPQSDITILAKELKTTGQVTLQTPVISTAGVNPELVTVIWGMARSAPMLTPDVTTNLYRQYGVTPENVNGTQVLTQTQLVQIAQSVGIPQSTIAQAIASNALAQVVIQAVAAQTVTPETTALASAIAQTATQTELQPVESIQPEITQAPLPDLGISTDTSTDTETETIVDTKTDTIVDDVVPPPEIKPPDKVEEGGKKPPFIIPDEDKTREQWDEEYTVDGAVAWKQGFGWWVIRPPYRGKEDMHFFYGAPPEGVKAVAGGAKSAFESIQAFGGEVPENLVVDLGIQNITISNPSGVPGAGEIKYSEDTAQSKKWAREPYGRRTLSDEEQSAPARRISSLHDAKARRGDTIEIEESGRYYLGRKLPDNIDIL